MSEDLAIRSYRRSYLVQFIADHEEILRRELRPGDHLVVDQNVWNAYPGLASCFLDLPRIIMDPSERAKSFEALAPILQRLIQNRFTKKNRLIAIGGGIVQDITAFTASILFRGVDWLFFPTTLLAQCDSCIGSKTSINFEEHKNQLGGFYPPTAIFIDSSFLGTLPDREIRSGLGEMMHYFLVSGETDYQWAADHLDEAAGSSDKLGQMIYRSLSIKKAMIERDEFDEGPRNVFNYGHSFGHALESATGYAVPHGIAVSYGMDIANLVASHLGLIPMALRNRIRSVLAKIWETVPLGPVDGPHFFDALAHDKKNEGAEIKVILTKGVGQMFKTTLALDGEIARLLEEYFRNKLYNQEL